MGFCGVSRRDFEYFVPRGLPFWRTRSPTPERNHETSARGGYSWSALFHYRPIEDEDDADIGRLKVIGLLGTALAGKTQITEIVGVTELDSVDDTIEFMKHAENGKVWDREPA